MKMLPLRALMFLILGVSKFSKFFPKNLIVIDSLGSFYWMYRNLDKRCVSGSLVFF